VELLTETTLEALAPALVRHDVEVASVDDADRLAETPAPAIAAQRVQPSGGLAGSALSPATWAKALDAVREMTVRR
jgi:hypothetical protein